MGERLRYGSLADEGIYIASESTLYRVLEAEGLNAHRQPTKPRTHHKPVERVADGQLLCWDITYLPTTVRGIYLYLYLFLDVWSRKKAVVRVDTLVRWYNHSAIGFVTPHDRHTGADIAILNARRLVYKRALRAHPERWTGNVRAWKRTDKVRLHPDRPAIALMQRKGGVAA